MLAYQLFLRHRLCEDLVQFLFRVASRNLFDAAGNINTEVFFGVRPLFDVIGNDSPPKISARRLFHGRRGDNHGKPIMLRSWWCNFCRKMREENARLRGHTVLLNVQPIFFRVHRLTRAENPARRMSCTFLSAFDAQEPSSRRQFCSSLKNHGFSCASFSLADTSRTLKKCYHKNFSAPNRRLRA